MAAESYAKELEQELLHKIDGEVRFDRGSRAIYSTDASNYRQVPIGVVIPASIDDVITTIKLCHKYHAPVLSRGGGTSLAGQSCNVAVVMDMSKYLNNIVELDVRNKRVRVQPGTILDDVRTMASEYDLTFGPDPATHSHCTFGGMLGNNSCGIHAQMAGRTQQNTHELEIVTYRGARMKVGPTSEEELEQIIQAGGEKGRIYQQLKSLRDRYEDEIRSRIPRIPRKVSGFNLEELLPENGFNVARALVGTEGTCVTILEATMNLVPNPPYRTLVVLGYPDVYVAGDHVPEILQFDPVGLEGIDDRLVNYMQMKHLREDNLKILPEGRGWLLVEFGGMTQHEANRDAERMIKKLKRQKNPPHMAAFDKEEDQDKVWKVRESGLGATAKVPGKDDTWPGWEDSAVPPEHVGAYLRGLRQLYDKYDLECSLYGHFGQGCIHTRIDFELKTQKGIEQYRNFICEAADLCLSYGGSLSGEHGDAQARGELLPKMYGKELTKAFREFKAIWDPDWKMNPGKVVEPYRMDDHLRLGTSYNPPEVQTTFQFPDDHHSFAYAANRCVGVGKCRRMDGGTMCPSYMVTREEKHSTRGRARILFEMLEGDPLNKGWQEEHVKDALDLCLACKGCKSDCPVNVDMATYKAEFLSHYFKGHMRPRSAYSMGLIYWWARLASKVPGLVNLMSHTPGISSVIKKIGGIAADRDMPKFAKETFRSKWERRKPFGNGHRGPVILWPDTFNDHFFPDVLEAAANVLEVIGYKVLIPKMKMCCGRPLYDYGMLGTAKGLLTQVMGSLEQEIQAGVPLVGVEPSCVATFRDELVNLFANNQNAHRLNQQTYIIGEFLAKEVENFQWPQWTTKAMVHGHCHQKAVLNMQANMDLLKKLGIEAKLLDSGCCGMAGSFGFEEEHYEVSVASGERSLFPSVREASADTLILTDGFSCREQIDQGTSRKAHHLITVVEEVFRRNGLFERINQRSSVQRVQVQEQQPVHAR